MRIVITGASGLIGKKTIEVFSQKGFEVIALSRKPEVLSREMLPVKAVFLGWPDPKAEIWSDWFSSECVVLNLAGENISSGRWTRSRKKRILDTRIKLTEHIVSAIKHARHKPLAMLQASATGFYGSRKDETLTENSKSGEGFLAEVVVAWENAAQSVESFGVRLCLLRTSVVLSNTGGAFPKLILPVKLFAGAWPGNGKQFFSWIHIDDWIRALEFVIAHQEIHGILNFTAPGALPLKDFVRISAFHLKRPVWGGIPSFLLKLAVGEMAEETLLTDQNVLPEKLLGESFSFSYPFADDAISALLK